MRSYSYGRVRNCGLLPTSQEYYAHLVFQLRSCRSFPEVKRVHELVVAYGHRRDKFLGNLLVKTYGCCGSVRDAIAAFETIACRNVFSWNMMMGAMLTNSQLDGGRGIFDSMPQRDVVTWDAMLTAYAQPGHLQEAKFIFDAMPQRDTISWNTHITAYHVNGDVDGARKAFLKTPQHSVVTLTAIVTAYSLNGDVQSARSLFEAMPTRNDVTWSAMIGAYVNRAMLAEGNTVAQKLPMWCVEVWNSLIHAHASEGQLEVAKNMFDLAPCRSTITWNTMVQAFAQSRQMVNARRVFDKMPQWEVVTYNVIITAYAQQGHLKEAATIFDKSTHRLQAVDHQSKTVHDKEAKLLFDGMPNRNIMSWTALLHAVSCYNIDEAKAVFDRMPQRHLVSWNTMLQAYASHGLSEEAINLFSVMDLEGLDHDEVSLVNVLEACTSIDSGPQQHLVNEARASPLSLTSHAVASSLLNAFANCGYINDAWGIFCGTSAQNVISWSSMVNAYALSGHPQQAIELLHTMALSGATPNEAMFVNLLAACRHGGLLHKGRELFASMVTDYGLAPAFDHYLCMVDLLARSGRVEDAECLVSNMPFEPSPAAWMAVFGACRTLGDKSRQAQAGGKVSTLDPTNETKHVASVLAAYLQ